MAYEDEPYATFYGEFSDLEFWGNENLTAPAVYDARPGRISGTPPQQHEPYLSMPTENDRVSPHFGPSGGAPPARHSSPVSPHALTATFRPPPCLRPSKGGANGSARGGNAAAGPVSWGFAGENGPGTATGRAPRGGKHPRAERGFFGARSTRSGAGRLPRFGPEPAACSAAQGRPWGAARGPLGPGQQEGVRRGILARESRRRTPSRHPFDPPHFRLADHTPTPRKTQGRRVSGVIGDVQVREK